MTADARPANAYNRRRTARTAISIRGEPWVWTSAGGLAVAAVMIAALLALIVYRGVGTFWPQPLVQVTTIEGASLLGEIVREERYRLTDEELASLPAETAAGIVEAGGWSTRVLLRTGNVTPSDSGYLWCPRTQIAATTTPPNGRVIEVRELGMVIGSFARVTVDGETVADGDDAVVAWLDAAAADIAARSAAIRTLQEDTLGRINAELEAVRLATRRAKLAGGDTPHSDIDGAAAALARLEAEYEDINRQLGTLRAADNGCVVEAAAIDGRTARFTASRMVRTLQPNGCGLLQRLRTYGDRWWEFLTADPREANTAGGVFPAIFGTVLMTLLMAVMVGPFGVVAGVYLREYARQGAIVSAIRIAVGNLAGVPSIVYGIFGLGFFCYGVGGLIDVAFFSERLPSPTFGTTGILWSSVTLALLTVPVVIVATEEALAAVPTSMREGSTACGASRWQTLHRIVLPKALPGILTGLILAMARGAGEVAPLMITGAVKLAPELPVDGHWPFVHLQRSFMHLGFHIYDVGFQSPNAEAAKPMVFTTTLLLITIVVLLNVMAMGLRARLRRRYREAGF